eukprot:gene45562-55765_t
MPVAPGVADLLRVSLTLSFSIYTEPKSTSFFSMSTPTPLPNVRENLLQQLLKNERERIQDAFYADWVSETPYPWTRHLRHIATVKTSARTDTIGELKSEIWFDESARHVFVSFRGTSTVENTVTNVQYAQSPLDREVFRGAPASGCVVHMGFQD